MSTLQTLFVAGDTAPDLTGTCSSGTTPANLTGATLELHFTRPDKTTLTGIPAIVDPLAGTWRYTWETGELVAGTWARSSCRSRTAVAGCRRSPRTGRPTSRSVTR